MSLDERDYMRERHRRLIDGATVSAGRHAAQVPARRRGWSVLLWLLLAGLVLLAVLRGGLPWAGLPTFPRTGEVRWVESPRRQALVPLRVQAPKSRWAHAVVLLRHPDSNRPVAMVPVRAGDAARLGVPAGRYRVTMIRGLGWRGPGRWFLWTVSTHELAGSAELFTGDQSAPGYELWLDRASERLQLSFAGD